jgi:UDP-2-acetamido-3-amino-2,3-dideoxy-glucuronate N-acetyltransferase
MSERFAGAHVAPGAFVAEDVVISPGAVVGDGVRISDGVVVGAGAVIEPGTSVGVGCVIEPCAVLGKRPRLRPGSSARAADELGGLVLEDGVSVCAGAVVYAGTQVAAGAIIGDQSQVRERVTIGAGTVVGRGSCVDFGSVVGERVLIQTSVYVTGGSVVEDDVFLGPGALTTNDDTMGRHPRGSGLRGPIFRRACRVGGGAVLVPGVEIGAEAFVAAGAVVTRDVGERQVVMGVPARVVRRVEDEDLIEAWNG